jgi:hypothetical protein
MLFEGLRCITVRLARNVYIHRIMGGFVSQQHCIYTAYRRFWPTLKQFRVGRQRESKRIMLFEGLQCVVTQRVSLVHHALEGLHC